MGNWGFALAALVREAASPEGVLRAVSPPTRLGLIPASTRRLRAGVTPFRRCAAVFVGTPALDPTPG